MASAEIAESVTHAITPAKCQDEYYPGDGNTELQCFPTLVDNRFYATLPSPNQGATNTIIFNPDQGLSDIVLTLQLPEPSPSASYVGWAFPNNWGQAMISQVALRIGGSSLYYFTGDQMFIDTLSDCESSDKKQAVADLAGGALLNVADFADLGNRTAQLYLKMPFNSISALQKTLALPTDLLTQPIQILVTFNSFANVAFWYGTGAPVLANLPIAFSQAQVNFRKTSMQSSEHLLARREDMNTHALTYPLRYFSQTTFRTNIQPNAYAKSQINLTGFRSGSIKYIDVWVNKLQNGVPVPGSNLNLVPIVGARLLINGLVMYDSQYNTAMWNLCERKTSAQFSTVSLTANSTNTGADAVPVSSSWLQIPFAQLCEPMAFNNVVNVGYPIQNSVVNLELVLAEGNGSVSYQVSAAYHYTASLIFSKNTAEYVF